MSCGNRPSIALVDPAMMRMLSIGVQARPEADEGNIGQGSFGHRLPTIAS